MEGVEINRTGIFRMLVGLYVIAFVASFVSFHRMLIPAEARQYADFLHDMFFDPWGSILWTIFTATNLLVMCAGAVLLVFLVRSGFYLFVVGSILMRVGLFFMSNPDAYPQLETTTSSHIYGATCVLWGAIVAIAFWDRANLFKQKTVA